MGGKEEEKSQSRSFSDSQLPSETGTTPKIPKSKVVKSKKTGEVTPAGSSKRIMSPPQEESETNRSKKYREGSGNPAQQGKVEENFSDDDRMSNSSNNSCTGVQNELDKINTQIRSLGTAQEAESQKIQTMINLQFTES